MTRLARHLVPVLLLHALLVPALLLLMAGCAGPSISIDASLSQLESAAVDDPNDFVAQFNLGAKHLSLKQYAAAQARFETAVAINPAFSLGHFALYCTAYAGDPALHAAAVAEEPDTLYTARIAEADGYLERAVAYYPFFDWRLSTVLLDQAPSTATLEGALIEYFFQGFRDFALGRYEQAEEGLTRTADLLPDFLQAHLFRGLARAQMQRYDAAMDDFAFVLARIEEAKQEQVLPVDLKTADLHYLIGHTRLAQGDIAGAEAAFKATLTSQFGYHMAHVQLALLHRKRRAYDAALRALDAARLAAGHDPMVALERGVVLMQLRRFDEAAETFAAAATLAPQYALPVFNTAAALEYAGRTEEARTHYARYLTLASPVRDADMVANARAKLEEL